MSVSSVRREEQSLPTETLDLQAILDEAARAVGSHPFAVSGPLDRARRDLELFLLQHRLEPALVRRGRQAISDRRP